MVHDIMLPAKDHEDTFTKVLVLVFQVVEVWVATKGVLLTTEILEIAL